MKKLLLLGALVLAIGANPAQAIVNGVPDGNAHPYVGMATGTGPDGRNSLCSGTRISADRFLTSGHCFAAESEVTIVFDEDGSSPTVSYTGTFTPSTTDDLGIVEVAGGMPGPYATLPALGYVDSLPHKQTATAVGYGIRVRAKEFAGEVKQRYQASVELNQSNSSSSDQYIKVSSNPSKEKGATCFGDSGGPILIDDTIIGVTAFGGSNCTGVSYAQRVDIPSARSFIDAA